LILNIKTVWSAVKFRGCRDLWHSVAGVVNNISGD